MTFKLPQEQDDQQLRDLSFLKNAYWIIILFLAAVLLNTPFLGLFGASAAH